MSYNIIRHNGVTRFWYNVLSTIKELVAIISNGTTSNVLQANTQGTSGNANFGFTVELDLGKYICFNGQLSNADNQFLIGKGVTQSDLTLTSSAGTGSIFFGDADFDPYARGQAGGACKLDTDTALVCVPQVGTGNVFKVITYSGGTANIVTSLTFNDGDTTNYVDRFPKFQVLKVAGSVYTVASTGLSRSGAFPYARVWDIDISGSGSATSRGIIYPMGTSGSGNGATQLCNLGTVGSKECFAIFYAKSTSGAGVAYYAVYEYNTATNTLVEVVGDTLYKSGSNLFEANVQFKIEDGIGIVLFVENSNTGQIAGVKWNGSTISIGSLSSFGSSSTPARFPAIRQYYNGQENSTSQFVMGAGVDQNTSGVKAVYNVFPASYNSTSNVFNTTDFNGSDSNNVLSDSSTTTTFSGVLHNTFIGLEDYEYGATINVYRDSVGTFRGSKMNSFKMSYN